MSDLSRSNLRRLAALKGEPAPDFSHTERIALALEERGIGDIEARAIAPLVEAAIEAVMPKIRCDCVNGCNECREDKDAQWAAALSALEGKEK